MGSDDTTETDRTRLPPGTITDRLAAVEKGDTLVVNDRERTLEVVDTGRYSVTAVDPRGNDYTISQNLQTGGWNVHEDVWWVASTDAAEGEDQSRSDPEGSNG